jgi:rhodanese-related sulfurtransferase
VPVENTPPCIHTRNTPDMSIHIHPRRMALRQWAALGLALGAGTLFSACSDAPPGADPLRVGLEEGRQLFESKQVLMFDIREPKEHATGVASGAVLLPMSQLNQRLNEIPKDPAQPVLLICNTQNRSGKVAQSMKDAGWTNVRYVHGGMSTWAKNGWPMVKPAQ